MLAGQRYGRTDPLAAAAGVSHKALVPVRGEAVIGHVLRAVEAAFPQAPVAVSIETPEPLARDPTAARLMAAGRLRHVEAAASLFDSIAAGADALGYPMLVTTADNALVTPDAMRRMAAVTADGGGDAVIGMARKADILAAHPGGKPRFYEFRDGGYSNCNLFWLESPAALRAAEAFRQGGQFLKVKGRMLQAFGLANLLAFRFGLRTLDATLRAVSRRLDTRIRPLVFDDGRLAIDVDDPQSLAMVEEILARGR